MLVRVYATNQVGTSDPSSVNGEGTAVIWEKPDAPTNVQTTNINADVKITWTAPSDDGSEAIDTYTVFVKDSVNSPTEVCSGVTLTECTVPLATLKTTLSLTQGDKVLATVTATNAVGTSDPSNEGGDAEIQNVPATPTSLTSTNNGSNIDLAWTPGDDGNENVNSFEVYIKSNSGSTIKLDSCTGTASSCTVALTVL